MGKIKLQRFALKFENRELTFKPNDTIIGNCFIALNGKMDLRQLEIKFVGIANVCWEEGSDDNKTTYSASHPCINIKYLPALSNAKTIRIL